MEGTNWSEGLVRVIWEVLPGDSEQIFREINQEDLDPGLFSPNPLINTDNFPTVPYPLLNPASDCLDRVWKQTGIKINYQPSEWFDEFDEYEL